MENGGCELKRGLKEQTPRLQGGSRRGCGRRIEAVFPERLSEFTDAIWSGTAGGLRRQRLLYGGAVRHGSRGRSRLE